MQRHKVIVMTTQSIPRPEHPNPMAYRENWQNLNGEWMFEIDYGVSGAERGMYKTDAKDKYTRKITVPFCPESELSGIGEKDFMPSVWYKRKINITKEQLCGRVLLHFGAVDYECNVYVNGVFVGNHFGGYSSFTLDITDYLQVGENDVTVNARDDLRSYAQPSGKQSKEYYSHGCDYTRTTGIWQTVWLEFVPCGYIKSAKFYPDVQGCAFDIELKLTHGGEVTAQAYYDGRAVGNAEKTAGGSYVRLHLPLDEKQLWEPGCGRLYDITLTLCCGDEVDTLQSYAGLREIALDGFRFMINGKSVFLRTVLDQGFYPDGIYTAPDKESLKNDIELSMSLGFNGARLHQKMFEPLFLYYCDKAGYLVFGEHANWGLDINNNGALMNFLPEWCETLERDFNHPSIIGWCPFNETWKSNAAVHDRILRAVYDETKRLDGTRPVIDASGWRHAVTDIYDVHDYEQNPDKFKKSFERYDGSRDSIDYRFKDEQAFIPNLPLFISEFGGIKWIPESERGGTADNSWGYGDEPKTEEEFFSRYEGLTAALLNAPNIMGFCYTQLYDVEQEVNGLYTYSRKKKFADYSRIIAANTKKAAIED